MPLNHLKLLTNMKTKTFKQIGLMLCMVASTIIISCNKEEVMDSTKIIGTWGCVGSQEYYYICYNGSNPNETESTDRHKGTVLTIKDDGTYTVSKEIYPFEDRGGSWMIDGNILLINNGHDSITVHTLSNNSLVLKYNHITRNYSYEERIDKTLEFSRQ